MRTLIVLCAGGRIINNQPVFLNRHPDGKLLAEKAIEGIYANSYDEIIFTILREVEEKYSVTKLLKTEIDKTHKIKLAILESSTMGPAESVYRTINMFNIEGEITVRDSLNGIKLQEEIRGNFVAGLDLTKYVEDIFNVRSKSFIVTNEQGQVLDIIEKRFRSDLISVGVYGFKKASDFLMAYENLNDYSYPIKKLYLSNIISYLIGYKQRIFHCIQTVFHEDWGFPETWNKLQNKYANLFIDIDQVIGKIYSDEYIGDLLVRLEKLSNSQNSVVLFTRGNSTDKKLLLAKLEERKIKCIGIICKVSNSSKQLIVLNEVDLEKIFLEI